ncbi:MAG: bifunctional folylpolyglutamate synthase/dihydrofolate synthase [Rhodospirillales bacterium]|nr:bifunctional folylpolyglutamate synthase/dihydrofolate synthase [Rhodospirillales bacterium]
MYQSDLKHPTPGLEDKLRQLYTLNRDKKIDLSFRPPYLSLLEKLGNPHLHLPPVIHVAGTNGKGSTIAMLRAILEAAGYKVHAYTSPHLIRFNERIVLAGREIDDTTLESLIDEALSLNDGGDLTFFEITTAIAFTAFARAPADICLLEVGMGGRLDCTNIITDPLATIITSIGIDHAEHLGDTYTQIAAEKAGIIKPSTPCIITPQSNEAITAGVIDVFKTTAEQCGAPLHIVEKPSEMIVPTLIGPHQNANLAGVLKTLACIHGRFPVTPEQIQTGLQGVHWPARLQPLPAKTFGLGDDWEVYLDGGHNPDAGRALAVQARRWQEQDNKPLHIILAMLQGKDTPAYYAPLRPFVESLSLIPIPSEPKAQSPQDLQKALGEGKIFTDVKAALTHIQKTAHPPGRILIAGSLYLAGHILQDMSKSAHT